jgi:hypothetical protein
MNDAVEEYRDEMWLMGKASCVCIGRKYNIPRQTLYKCVMDCVKGKGVLAGNQRHTRVLGQDKLAGILFLC